MSFGPFIKEAITRAEEEKKALVSVNSVIESLCIADFSKAKIKDETLIPENILAKQKLEKELKEKRKKEHFFHGEIRFNT